MVGEWVRVRVRACVRACFLLLDDGAWWGGRKRSGGEGGSW